MLIGGCFGGREPACVQVKRQCWKRKACIVSLQSQAVWENTAGELKGFGESLHSLYTDRKATEPANLLVAVHDQIVAGPVDREGVELGGGVECQPVNCSGPISSAFHAWLWLGQLHTPRSPLSRPLHLRR